MHSILTSGFSLCASCKIRIIIENIRNEFNLAYNMDLKLFVEKSPNQSRHSPKPGVEQHSFTNLLRRTSSPARTKKSPEPQQVNFKDVLTKKVVTNQHKQKTPPLVPSKPAMKNGTRSAVIPFLIKIYATHRLG